MHLQNCYPDSFTGKMMNSDQATPGLCFFLSKKTASFWFKIRDFYRFSI